MNKNKLKVIVWDEQPLFRYGLLRALYNLNFFSVIQEAHNIDEFNGKMAMETFDIIFLETNVPEIDYVPFLNNIKRKYPHTHIIVLTSHFGKREIIEFIELGISGLLLKHIDPHELSKAIDIILKGDRYFSNQVNSVWIDYLSKRISNEKYLQNEHLTRKEIEIISLIGKQKTAKEIGDELFISEGTVIKHKSNIMGKIGAQNVVGIVLFGIRNNIIIP